jgi:polyphosphate kinase 2 (PPK2 family)
MPKDDRRRAPRLADADLTKRLTRERYEAKLERLQHRLSQIQQAYLTQRRSAVIVMEGWDAAGKGGTIRRLSARMDPRGFKVWPIGAPRTYYLERHFLARFMERLPPCGAIAVFDRSWYGRVLVERVEGLTPTPRWKAAYREIRDFERMLHHDGTRIVKLFFHISPEEQLERFEDRLREPMKRWKLSYEDFRNRARWDDYVTAIDDMLEKTHTDHAPWVVIPSEQKKYGRIRAMTEIARRLGQGVDLDPPQLSEEVVAAAIENFDMAPDLVRELAGRTD